MIGTSSRKRVTGKKDIDWFAAHGYGVDTMKKSECMECLEFFNPVSLRNGEFLFTEGEPDDQLFIIRDGAVEMGQLAAPRHSIDFGPYGPVTFADDEERTLNDWLRLVILREGECAGEVGFVAHEPHKLAARARGDVELFQVDARNIHGLAGKSALLCRHLAMALAMTHQKIALAG
ncbi:MAG: cyclic nucleotide-binding domain-containing protein [Magnetococcus sp. XQGC-1]